MNKQNLNCAIKPEGKRAANEKKTFENYYRVKCLLNKDRNSKENEKNGTIVNKMAIKFNLACDSFLEKENSRKRNQYKPYETNMERAILGKSFGHCSTIHIHF